MYFTEYDKIPIAGINCFGEKRKSGVASRAFDKRTFPSSNKEEVVMSFTDLCATTTGVPKSTFSERRSRGCSIREALTGEKD